MPIGGGSDFCSPDSSPKVDGPAATFNGFHLEPSNPTQDPMPEMFYAPSSDAYSCPPVFLVPFPCMMGQSGQVLQFPCQMDQRGQMVWVLPNNGCHPMQPGIDSWVPRPMYNESAPFENKPSPEEIISASSCKDLPRMTADMDQIPSAPEVGTWVKKMAAVHEEGPQQPGLVVPQSEMPTLDDDVAALGNPRQMIVNEELAAYVVEQLESSNQSTRVALLSWMQPAVVDLALSANGTHVIQKAIECTGGESQVALSQRLHGRVRQLLDSHHGNHVLQKMIRMMPPNAVQFIHQELSFYSGGWPGVFKHRFGCRVVERLLEHCDPESESTAPIVAAVVADIDSLSRHPFANYVIQHVLEHRPAHHGQVVHALIQADVPWLAQHRVASNIVERAFETGDAEIQRALAEAILSTPNAIVEMGSSRYGSFTVRKMLDALQDPLHYMALEQLARAIPRLRASKHGRHIAARVCRVIH